MFEWDEAKEKSNIEKHGISFKQASEVFLDPIAITFADPDHSQTEIREITIGSCSNLNILMVIHTSRDGIIRIISARQASGKERELYE